MFLRLAACLLLIVSNILMAAEPIHHSIKFGILNGGEGQLYLVMETNEIPNIPMSQGLAYGIEVSPPNDFPYVVRMVVYLPDEPEKLTGIFSGLDPTTATEGLSFPEYKFEGKAIVPMGLDEGDPLGIYKLQVYINDTFTKTIEFEVKTPR